MEKCPRWFGQLAGRTTSQAIEVLGCDDSCDL